MTVVAKFLCHTHYQHEHVADRTVISMGGVWEGSNEAQAKSENAIFGEATPMATLSMHIANPEAAAFFKGGKKYFVTFTEAPD